MIEITHLEMIDDIVKIQGFIWIYKYNPNNCGLSNRTRPIVEAAAKTKQRPVYRIDIINHTEVSDHVATLRDIEHESPQLIILQDGHPESHTSHMHIQEERLAQY